jgi:hypothetical protein
MLFACIGYAIARMDEMIAYKKTNNAIRRTREVQDCFRIEIIP